MLKSTVPAVSTVNDPALTPPPPPPPPPRAPPPPPPPINTYSKEKGIEPGGAAPAVLSGFDADKDCSIPVIFYLKIR
jgi:hypothetical protein